MADHTPRGGSKASGRKHAPTSITNAKTGSSRELASREKRYAITMGIRTACFLAMLLVSGPMRWVLLAGAVFLPYLAVLFANQADATSKPDTKIEQGEPTAAPQLTTGPPPAEVIDGEWVDIEPTDEELARARRATRDEPAPDDTWTQHDRVA